MPRARAEKHKTSGGRVYWLIRDGNTYMWFAEGATLSKAWMNAKFQIQENEKSNTDFNSNNDV